MRSGIEATADDDAHRPEAGLVEARPDLQHQVSGDAAALGRGVEPNAVEPVPERMRDAQRLLRLVLEGIDEHDAGHVRRTGAGRMPRPRATVSPKMSTREWGIVPVGARPASRAPAGVEAPTQPPTMAA